jgi:hypothetical protein
MSQVKILSGTYRNWKGKVCKVNKENYTVRVRIPFEDGYFYQWYFAEDLSKLA